MRHAIQVEEIFLYFKFIQKCIAVDLYPSSNHNLDIPDELFFDMT